jgi:hypothetical protein
VSTGTNWRELEQQILKVTKTGVRPWRRRFLMRNPRE